MRKALKTGPEIDRGDDVESFKQSSLWAKFNLAPFKLIRGSLSFNQRKLAMESFQFSLHTNFWIDLDVFLIGEVFTLFFCQFSCFRTKYL